MVPYEVPQFLTTCDHTTKEPAKNLGVQICRSFDEKVHEVVQAAKRFHTSVPVLIITQGKENDELAHVVRALSDALTEDPRERLRAREKMGREWANLRIAVKFGQATTAAGRATASNSAAGSVGSPMGGLPPAIRRSSDVGGLHPRIQVLQERDENGASLIDKCNVIIDQATKRCYSETREAFFRITVTDWFGGRGHDFDCLSEDANAAGGMLVIATSIPDAREWAQWKAHSAAGPAGQYMVVLAEDDEPFGSEPGLADSLRPKEPDAIIDELLRRKNAGTAEALAAFQAQQARGAWQNELCERYFAANPRAGRRELAAREGQEDGRTAARYAVGAVRFGRQDRRGGGGAAGSHATRASRALGLVGFDAFDIEGPRREMAVIFLIDRTYIEFLQKVVDAVLKVYDKYLLPTDLVGYYGLGEDWIFGMREKGTGDANAALRSQIEGSVKKAGEPHVYSSIQKCVEALQEVDDKYSKWLVVPLIPPTSNASTPRASPTSSRRSGRRWRSTACSTTQAMAGSASSSSTPRASPTSTPSTHSGLRGARCRPSSRTRWASSTRGSISKLPT